MLAGEKVYKGCQRLHYKIRIVVPPKNYNRNYNLHFSLKVTLAVLQN